MLKVLKESIIEEAITSLMKKTPHYLHMASCYEAVTQRESEMQANVNKIDAKSATRNSKMAG